MKDSQQAHDALDALLDRAAWQEAELHVARRLLRKVSDAPRTGAGMGGMVDVRLNEALLGRIDQAVREAPDD